MRREDDIALKPSREYCDYIKLLDEQDSNINSGDGKDHPEHTYTVTEYKAINDTLDVEQNAVFQSEILHVIITDFDFFFNCSC